MFNYTFIDNKYLYFDMVVAISIEQHLWTSQRPIKQIDRIVIITIMNVFQYVDRLFQNHQYYAKWQIVHSVQQIL